MTDTSYEGVEALTIAKNQAGKHVYIYRGQPVPEDVTAAEIDRLAGEGFIRPTDAAEPKAKSTRKADTASNPNTTEGILAAVGDDVDKATAALAAEQESARPRKGLMEKLEEIITKPAGDGDGGNDGKQS